MEQELLMDVLKVYNRVNSKVHELKNYKTEYTKRTCKESFVFEIFRWLLSDIKYHYFLFLINHLVRLIKRSMERKSFNWFKWSFMNRGEAITSHSNLLHTSANSWFCLLSFSMRWMPLLNLFKIPNCL